MVKNNSTLFSLITGTDLELHIWHKTRNYYIIYSCSLCEKHTCDSHTTNFHFAHNAYSPWLLEDQRAVKSNQFVGQIRRVSNSVTRPR
jgi:hypothetical protein